MPTISKRLLAVCRGDEPADALFVNARIVDVFGGGVVPGSFAVAEGRFAGVFDPASRDGARVVDLKGAVVCPGFIDAHMHVESTMMPPSEFVTLASPHGTTAVVADPHEIANVLGLAGIRWMMENGAGLAVRFLWSVSSCVPSCHLETSGATLEAGDLAPLLNESRDDIAGLAEMMNFPGVVGGNDGVLAKVALGLAARGGRGVVDGHAPRLSGPGLHAYVSAGISSDHECTTPEEAREKLRLGMRVFIRQGSAARNLAALAPIVTAANASRVCFCTDDRHPADLLNEGHIDHVVRLAIGAGIDPVTAIRMATINTAEHYRRTDLGAIAPGRWADFVALDALESARPVEVYASGLLVASRGEYAGPRKRVEKPSGGGVTLPRGLSAASFRIGVPTGNTAPLIRVIGMDPRQLITDTLTMPARTAEGAIVADPARDLLKLAVIERHQGAGNIGLGLVKGFGFGGRGGAIASTVGHDAHNLAVAGANDDDMLAAAKELERLGGGQCVVQNGRVLASLPLPIAGLMSDLPSAELIERQHALHHACRAIGCPLEDPFMPLSFLPLPVIPHLKLSDKGLVDVDRFTIVPLVVEAAPAGAS